MLLDLKFEFFTQRTWTNSISELILGHFSVLSDFLLKSGRL